MKNRSRLPKRPIPPMAMYEALHPTSLIRRIVIEDRAIPAKLAEDRIELAVVLLSGGK